MAEARARDERIAEERRRIEAEEQARVDAAAAVEAARLPRIEKSAAEMLRAIERERLRETAPTRAAWTQAGGQVVASRKLQLGGLMTEVTDRQVGEVAGRVKDTTIGL